MGTIETTCSIVACMLRGQTYDRNSLARDFEVTPATADRYLRHLLFLPGMVASKRGRLLSLSFSYGAALKAIGR